MKRNYLTTPGQSIRISLTGPSSCGKTALIGELQGMFAARGLIVTGASGDFKSGLYEESFRIECPTPKQAQAMYFETLSEHEIETLKGHLSALGYEL